MTLMTFLEDFHQDKMNIMHMLFYYFSHAAENTSVLIIESTSSYHEELYRYTNTGTTLLWHDNIQGCFTVALVIHRLEAVHHAL